MASPAKNVPPPVNTVDSINEDLSEDEPEEELPPPEPPEKITNKIQRIIRSNMLTILTILGVILGICLGIILRWTVKSQNEKWTDREIQYVEYLGMLYLNLIKGTVLPLIISSLITAVGSLDLSLSRIIGGRGLAIYSITTLIAMGEGVFIVLVVNPGKFGKHSSMACHENKTYNLPEDNILDLGRNIFVPNIFQATMQMYQTALVPPNPLNPCDANSGATLGNKRSWKLDGGYVEGTNLMGVIFSSFVFGVAICVKKSKGKAMLDFFRSLSDVSMRITGWVVWITPIGVVSLLAAQILRIDDFESTLVSLGVYVGCVIGIILFHGFVTLPLLFFLTTRKNPLPHMTKLVPAVLTAFGTSSSAAALPVTIQCVEEGNHVDPRIARYLLPIGATVNMDGVALYDSVAALFLAQLVGLELTPVKVVAVCFTAVSTSIGTAAVPQGSITAMVMVLTAVGLPPTYISYIIGADWLLDRIVTALNVFGDGMACSIVQITCKKELERLIVREKESELTSVYERKYRDQDEELQSKLESPKNEE